MRKYFLFALILAVMLVTAGTAYADALYSNSPDDNLSIEVLTSTAAGSIKAPSNITSNNRLLGYLFLSTTAGTVGIYDATQANAMAGTGLIGEDSVIATGSTQVWFAFPYNISVGIQVIFSAADGVITLYYE